jgi:hypothetical protein
MRRSCGEDRMALLEDVEGWPAEYATNLKKNWITTAEQVVAIAATAGGLSALASQLATSEANLKGLVDLAKQTLPADVIARLEQPVDTSHFGLGGIGSKTSDSKRR